MSRPRLVVFGTSNIISDLFDCALANGFDIGRVVLHHAEQVGERDRSLAERLAALAPFGQTPQVDHVDRFVPGADELYLLGPTTPTRAELAALVAARWALPFATLVHPSAYVSPLAALAPGVFVGANSVLGPGVRLGEHVFVNRGVTVGHDTVVGAFSRLQPGCNLGGLSLLGRGVTVAIGATVLERLRIGDGAFIGAGSVVTADVAADSLAVGVPARVRKLTAP